VLDKLGESERSSTVLLALHFAEISLGAPIKPDQLVTALKTPTLRPLALRYLIELSPAIATDLQASLQNPDAQIRAGVADALGFSHAPSVIPALEAAAKDRDTEAAHAAQRAIDRIRLAR
jgi:HEAT repeat protein